MDGWIVPNRSTATMAHFFVNGRSICGSWTFVGGNGYRAVSNTPAHPSRSRCKACAKKQGQ